ncbi:MAG: hypothetical protein E7Z96_05290 [Actinomycetaceae bacterium]|nr:hypothetical protein [Actinomycetaceae bacterium]
MTRKPLQIGDNQPPISHPLKGCEMLRVPKRTAALAPLAAAGMAAVLLVAVGILGARGATEQASGTDVSSLSKSILVATYVEQLETNRTELMAQQDSERAQAAQDLQLPAGVDFGPGESPGAIDEQISGLKSTLTDPSVTAADIPAPELYWYEDGFFASLMVIDWQCGWLSTGIKQVEANDMAGVQESVEMLYSLQSTQYVEAFPEYDAFLSEQVDPLLQGDTSGAELFLPNCVN